MAITVTHDNLSIECTKAVKCTNKCYIHCLDADNNIIAAFDKIEDFEAFTISGGDWSNPDATASGNYSEARGQATTANGNYSTAIGHTSTAKGDYAIAIGPIATANNHASTAIGQSVTASGNYTTAIGKNTTASSEHSTAIGNNANASDKSATAIGQTATASARCSTAIGEISTASGKYSTAIGSGTKAQGNYSTAIGQATTANYDNQFCIGKYNDNQADSVFEIGGGTSNTDLKNLMRVTNDGSIHANDLYTILEPGTSKYMSFNDLYMSVNPSESGWRTPTLNSGAEMPTSNGIRYRKRNGIVYIEGSIKVTNKTSAALNAFSLPEGYRPNFNLYQINTGSGVTIARWYITSSGTVGLDWLYSLANQELITGAIDWVGIAISYPVV